MKSSPSKLVALKTEITGSKNVLFAGRVPGIVQPGNFTGSGNEGVKGKL